MSDWWFYVLLIAILAALGILYLRLRSRREPSQTTGGADSGPRDFTSERETTRVGQLSDEDRAWEASSLQKDRDAEDRDRPA
jgi:membrane protein implicated in regulation of membrane protease activity